MRTSKVLLVAASACIATLGIYAPGLAQQKNESAARETSSSERDEATNRALLAALLSRRAEIAQSTGDPEGKRYALGFVDRQIDGATNRAMLAALLNRRARIAQSAGDPEGKRDALEFLDGQIAKVRDSLGE
jgi:hypothetical protein